MQTTASPTKPASSSDASEQARQDFETRRKADRNALWAQHGWFSMIFFTAICVPTTLHGTETIYSPDIALPKLKCFVKLVWKRLGGEVTTAAQSAKKEARASWSRWFKKNWLWTIALLAFAAAFWFKGDWIKCTMESWFLAWADSNSKIGTSWTGMFVRLANVTAMMEIRLVVANILPFTSPVFAYLVATSMAPGRTVYGVPYMLLAAAITGFTLPLLDLVLYHLFGKNRSQSTGDHEGAFIATNIASKITDYLPFSFWVKPYVMRPAWKVARDGANTDEGKSCSAATLAGHFMIWAGPATTMYQRQFVPDLITAVLIQPLGLMEDVAVVLATWAGESVTAQTDAEVALYIFMLVLNIVRFTIRCCSKAPENVKKNQTWNWQRKTQHFIVGLLTLGTIYARLYAIKVNPLISVPSGTTTTTTTTTMAGTQQCGETHSNTKAMLCTVVFVSSLAFLFRAIARLFTGDLPDCSSTSPELTEDLLEAHTTQGSNGGP